MIAAHRMDSLLRHKPLVRGLVGLAAVTTFVNCEGVPESESVASMSQEFVGVYRLKVQRDSIIGSSASCDNRAYTGSGDWFSGRCKTECPQAIAGIASTGFVQHHSGQAEWTDMLGCADWLAAYPAYNLYVDPGSSNAYTLRFQKTDDIRSPNVAAQFGGDWAPNLVKGECDDYSAMTGIATERAGQSDMPCSDGWFTECNPYYTPSWAYGVVGARCAPLVAPSGFVASAMGCAVMDISYADDREGDRTNDWDSGYLKAECGYGRYVKGIAHDIYYAPTGSGRVVKVLCCTGHVYRPIIF